jgi:hypothetical protein
MDQCGFTALESEVKIGLCAPRGPLLTARCSRRCSRQHIISTAWRRHTRPDSAAFDASVALSLETKLVAFRVLHNDPVLPVFFVRTQFRGA